MLSRLCVQLITLFCQLVGSVLVGLLPLFIIRAATRGDPQDQAVVSKKNRVVSFLIHFGGGVFLSTCFLILIPESQERFSHHSEDPTAPKSYDGHHHEAFPIPEFVVLCGFFGTFAIEELIKFVIRFYLKKRASKHQHSPRVRFCSCAKRHTECSRAFKADSPAEQTIYGLEKNMLYSDSAAERGETSTLDRSDGIATPKTSLLQSSILDQAVPSYGSVTSLPDPQTMDTPHPVAPPVIIANDGNVTIIHHHPTSPSYTDSITNALLLASLSLFAVIRGMSLGEDVGHASWGAVLVGCLQQTVLVFVVGSVVVPDSKRAWPVFGYVLPLSGMYSLGIFLAALLESEVDEVAESVWGAGLAVVCGSLLYLIFCDLFRRDGVRKMCGREKFVGFTIGAAVVAVLLYFTSIL